MADKKDKAGFLLYKDTIEMIDVLNMKQRGQLFTAILEFENYGTVPEFKDKVLQALSKVIIGNLIRSDAEYEKNKAKQAEEGKLGGIIRALKNGQDITINSDNIRFLYDRGMLTRDYLVGKRQIDPDKVDKFLNSEPCRKVIAVGQLEQSTNEPKNNSRYEDKTSGYHDEEYEPLPFH